MLGALCQLVEHLIAHDTTALLEMDAQDLASIGVLGEIHEEDLVEATLPQ